MQDKELAGIEMAMSTLSQLEGDIVSAAKHTSGYVVEDYRQAVDDCAHIRKALMRLYRAAAERVEKCA